MTITFRSLLLLSCLPAMTACVPTTPRVDQDFGESLAMLRAQQVLDPQAPQRNENRPAYGLDGRSARETMDRYYKGFAAPAKYGNALTINIGGAGGAAPANQ